MSPPRPGNTVPPDHSPLVMDLTGYERSGQGFATQNFSVRVTGRQKPLSSSSSDGMEIWDPSVLLMGRCGWQSMGDRPRVTRGNVKKEEACLLLEKYAVFPR